MLTPPDIIVFAFLSQGKYDEAVTLYKESLAIRKKVFGDEHPSVAESLKNLAVLWWKQNNFQKAEPMFEESVRICQRVLGCDHPQTKNYEVGLQMLKARLPCPV